MVPITNKLIYCDDQLIHPAYGYVLIRRKGVKRNETMIILFRIDEKIERSVCFCSPHVS